MKKSIIPKALNYVSMKIYRKATILFIYRELADICQVHPSLNISYSFLGVDRANEIESNDYLKREQIYALFNRGAICLGAFVDGKLAGYVWAQFRPTSYPFFDYEFVFEEDAYVGPDYVFPEFRGNKIHGALSTRMFAYLKKSGFNGVWSSVWQTNYSSIKGLIEVEYYPKFQICATRVFDKLIYKKMDERTTW